jgi:hypothetical protein
MKDDFALWALKQKVPLRWLLTTVLAMLGGFALSLKLGTHLSDVNNTLEAHEKAIVAQDDAQNIMVRKLETIDQRLSRIEGQLDLIRGRLAR